MRLVLALFTVALVVINGAVDNIVVPYVESVSQEQDDASDIEGGLQIVEEPFMDSQLFMMDDNYKVKELSALSGEPSTHATPKNRPAVAEETTTHRYPIGDWKERYITTLNGSTEIDFKSSFKPEVWNKSSLFVIPTDEESYEEFVEAKGLWHHGRVTLSHDRSPLEHGRLGYPTISGVRFGYTSSRARHEDTDGFIDWVQLVASNGKILHSLQTRHDNQSETVHDTTNPSDDFYVSNATSKFVMTGFQVERLFDNRSVIKYHVFPDGPGTQPHHLTWVKHTYESIVDFKFHGFLEHLRINNKTGINRIVREPASLGPFFPPHKEPYEVWGEHKNRKWGDPYGCSAGEFVIGFATKNDLVELKKPKEKRDASGLTDIRLVCSSLAVESFAP